MKRDPITEPKRGDVWRKTNAAGEAITIRVGGTAGYSAPLVWYTVNGEPQVQAIAEGWERELQGARLMHRAEDVPEEPAALSRR